MSRWSEDSQPYRRARRQFLADHPICWICGHPYANQIDHDPPQSQYRSRMDMDTWRPSHGPPGCPTCGRCCNQERGTRPLAALTPHPPANRQEWSATRQVTLVCGPPCAGKTTYVAQHAEHGDIVLDQDLIGAQAMREGLAHIAAMTDGTAWVIRCAPGPTQREALARQLGAEVVLLDPGEPEAIHRAAHRPNPRRHIQAVRYWYQHEAAGQRPRTGPRHRTNPCWCGANCTIHIDPGTL